MKSVCFLSFFLLSYLIPLNFRAPFIFAPLFFAPLIFAHPRNFIFRAPLIFAHQFHFAPLKFSRTLNLQDFFSGFCSFEVFSSTNQNIRLSKVDKILRRVNILAKRLRFFLIKPYFFLDFRGVFGIAARA